MFYDKVAVFSRIRKSRNTRFAIAMAALFSLFFVCIGVGAEGLCVLPAHTIDLGEFPAESEQSTTFTLSNATPRVIQIRDMKSCCAMVVPVIYEKNVPPGDSIPLDVFIDAMSLDGPFSKSITLSTDDPASPSVELLVKGTSVPAISTPTPRVFAGWTIVGQPWSTNLEVTLRNGLSGKLVATTQSNIGLKARLGPTNATSCQLELSAPEQQEPISWSGTVDLQIEGTSEIPPLTIYVDGCMGGSLHPQIPKLVLSGENPAQASFKLFRKYPSPPPSSPPLLRCSDPAIQVKEVFLNPEESTITMIFPEDFLKRLKQQTRIPIQLDADGCIPATLMIEYAP